MQKKGNTGKEPTLQNVELAFFQNRIRTVSLSHYGNTQMLLISPVKLFPE